MRQRQPNNPDVIALLWEVKRLRTYPLQLHLMATDLKRPAGLMGTLFDGVIEALRSGAGIGRPGIVGCVGHAAQGDGATVGIRR